MDIKDYFFAYCCNFMLKNVTILVMIMQYKQHTNSKCRKIFTDINNISITSLIITICIWFYIEIILGLMSMY